MRAMKVFFDEVGNDWSLVATINVATEPGEMADDGESMLPTADVVAAMVAELNAGLKALRDGEPHSSGADPINVG